MLFSIWVAVQLEPLPTMTGTRPPTTLMVWATTAASSSWDMVEYSPVVPRVKIPSVPAAIWRSSSWVKTSKFTEPSSWKGVTMATMEPCRCSNFIVVSSILFVFRVQSPNKKSVETRPYRQLFHTSAPMQKAEFPVSG